MKILNLQQGSPEWRAARANYHCASDAPAMMGEGKITRTELIRMKATGDEREFSDWAQANLIDKGHEVEAFARTEVEREIGEDLYPVTATDDEGYLLASFDGITMDGETGFECKLWNAELVAAMHRGDILGHKWQVEEQIKVGGLKRVIFICTDGTRDKFLRLDYTPVPGRAAQLMAAWRQFDEDVANYQHVEVIPKAVAAPVMDLPAVAIEIKGEIELVSNLPRFGERLTAFIAAIPTKPATDQEFADCEAALKVLQLAEDKLDLAESSSLARLEDIDEMRRQVAMWRELARARRLALEKLVKGRKDEIRSEILIEGAAKFAEHIKKLNDRLGKPYMPTIPARFADVMKGKKSVTSLRDAVETEVARLKIESNNVADAIEINLRHLRERPDYAHLFADIGQVCLKANDDFVALVATRIAAEDKRLADAREQIRLEEEAKARAKVEAEAKAKAEEEAIALLASAKPAPAPVTAAPATATAAAPATARPAAVAPAPQARPNRPSDDAIIAALALHFHVHESQVITWLLDMDLEAASAALATEFAG